MEALIIPHARRVSQQEGARDFRFAGLLACEQGRVGDGCEAAPAADAGWHD